MLTGNIVAQLPAGSFSFSQLILGLGGSRQRDSHSVPAHGGFQSQERSSPVLSKATARRFSWRGMELPQGYLPHL